MSMQAKRCWWILLINLIINTQTAQPGKWISTYLLFCNNHSRDLRVPSLSIPCLTLVKLFNSGLSLFKLTTQRKRFPLVLWDSIKSRVRDLVTLQKSIYGNMSRSMALFIRIMQEKLVTGEQRQSKSY